MCTYTYFGISALPSEKIDDVSSDTFYPKNIKGWLTSQQMLISICCELWFFKKETWSMSSGLFFKKIKWSDKSSSQRITHCYIARNYNRYDKNSWEISWTGRILSHLSLDGFK